MQHQEGNDNKINIDHYNTIYCITCSKPITLETILIRQ